MAYTGKSENMSSQDLFDVLIQISIIPLRGVALVEEDSDTALVVTTAEVLLLVVFVKYNLKVPIVGIHLITDF